MSDQTNITDGFHLYDPKVPVTSENYLIYKPNDFLLKGQLDECKTQALVVGSLLQKVWNFVGGELYDFKLEFGIHPKTGEIV